VDILASDEFIRMNDLAIAHICLLEVFAAEAEYEVGSLDPWDYVGDADDGEDREEARGKEGAYHCKRSG
jgi:hypothetical protein